MRSDESGAGSELYAKANLAMPMALRVAATLRIADHIAGGVRTAAELADLVHADADALGRLLHYLTVRGVLSRDESGRYALASVGEALRDDHPAGLRAILDIEGAPGRAELSFVQLLHSVRTGEAAYPALYGRAFWDDLAADPALAESFDAWMGSTVAERGPAILTGYDWGSLGHVVDVGGGDGSLLIALVTAYPGLRGTVVDLPGTAESARKALAMAGLSHRVDIVSGSFFDPLPPGADGYVLSFILHDWGDDAARVVLRRCAEAAGSDGSVFVVERIRGESTSSAMDMRMLAHCGGKERGVAEIAELAATCGLRMAAAHPAGELTIVELSPA